MAKRVAIVLGTLTLLLAGTVYYALHAIQRASFWESEIEAFEAADHAAMPAPGGVLFVGSSSIRFWDTLEQDMAPLPVIQRGFGGAHLEHVNHYATRIVLPYRPAHILLYAGDNDLGFGTGKTPETILRDFRRFVAIVHEALPETRIDYISIKPSRLRWSSWPSMRRANELIAAHTASDDRLGFIDIATPMLPRDNKPERALFRFDGLHLSEAGYALWTKQIRPVVEERWRVRQSARPTSSSRRANS